MGMIDVRILVVFKFFSGSVHILFICDRYDKSTETRTEETPMNEYENNEFDDEESEDDMTDEEVEEDSEE